MPNTAAKSAFMNQTLYLFSMRGLGLACQAVAMLLLASVLPEEDFGRYGLFVGFLMLTQLLAEVGIFTSAGRAGTFREGREFRQMVGFVVIASALLSVLYVGALFALAAGANRLDKTYFEPELWPAILLAPGLLLHYGLCQTCEASSRTGVLGSLRVTPYILNLLGVVVLWQTGMMSYAHAALCYCGSFLLASTAGAIALKPRFDSMSVALQETRGHLRFGWDIYVSRVFAMGVYKLDAPLVALFLNFQAVGYYTLARSLVVPFAMLTRSFAATRYKEYAKSSGIPRQHLLAVHAISVGVAVVPFALAPSLLPWFFPNKPFVFFLLVQLLAIRVFFQSASSIYNMYFIASGQSLIVRRTSVWTSVLNLVLYLTLIPVFGVFGVAAADVFDYAAYYFCLWIAYRRQSRLGPGSDGIDVQPADDEADHRVAA
jgi:O-antigen/teichoic acid export membrane protein